MVGVGRETLKEAGAAAGVMLAVVATVVVAVMVVPVATMSPGLAIRSVGILTQQLRRGSNAQ